MKVKVFCLLLFLLFGAGANTFADGNATMPVDSVDMADIHDIKPIIDMGPDLGWLVWAAVAVLILALLALAWWLWRRRRKSYEAELEAIVLASPEEEANQLLDELAADQSLNGKQFYFRLSYILRRYLERRYGFPAAEMTIEELLPRVDQLPIQLQLLQPLKALSQRAEPIKFAGAVVHPKQMPDDLRFVRDFVIQTAPVEPNDDTPTTPEAGINAIPHKTSEQPINESTS